jgi:hypothetical protein
MYNLALGLVLIATVMVCSASYEQQMKITITGHHLNGEILPEKFEWLSSGQLFFLTNRFNPNDYKASKGYFVSLPDSSAKTVNKLAQTLLQESQYAVPDTNVLNYNVQIEVWRKQQRSIYMIKCPQTDTSLSQLITIFTHYSGIQHRFKLKQPYTYANHVCQPN